MSGRGKKSTPTKIKRPSSLFWQCRLGSSDSISSSSTVEASCSVGRRAEEMSPPSQTPTPSLCEETEESSMSQVSVHLELEESEDLLADTEGMQVAPETSSDARSTDSGAVSQCTGSDTTSQGVTQTVTETGQAQGRCLRKPRGSLWQHFDSNPDDPRLAMCKRCKVVVRRGIDLKHLSSSALSNHLQRHHPGVLPRPPAATGSSATGRTSGVGQAGKRMEATGTSAERANRQATLQEMVPLGVGFPSQRARGRAQESTTRVVGEMVAMGGLPLSFVESAAFRHLMKNVAPWYEPPSRRTLSRRVIPSLFESTREKVRGNLQAATGRTVHFTSDLWTGGHNAFLSLTAHWWQPEGVLGGGAAEEVPQQGEAEGNTRGYRVALLQAQCMDDSATGANIAEVLQSALREWAPEGQVKRGMVVTDAGRNMLAALQRAGLEGIVCTAHKLHLVVHDALGLGPARDTWCAGTRETKALLDKVRQLVGHFSRSVKAARLLREKQVELGRAEHVLLQDLPTRWNSTYEMVQRLVEQRDVLENIMNTAPIMPGGRELDIGPTEWLALSQMVGILRPFQDTTNVLSGRDASLGHVLPLVHALRQGLDACLCEDDALLPRSRALAERLLTGVETRLAPLSRERVYRLACLCDPRVKGSLAKSTAELQTWRAELCREVRRQVAMRGQALPREQALEASSQGSSSSAGYTPTPRPSAVPSTYLASALAMAVSCSLEGRESEEHDTVQSMVREYMAEPLQPLTADPLRYWARKAALWPQLSSLALDLLSIPPTSVQSERVFSQMGDILRTRRSRLDPGTVEKLTFIRFNLSTES